MEPVSVILGFACMGAIACTVHGDDRDSLAVALLLTAVWAVAYVVWWCDQLRYLPVLDLLVGASVESIRRVRPSKAMTTVYGMAFVSIIIDCAYDYYGHDTIVPYGHALNLAFFVQLLAVSYPGGRNGIDRLCRCFGDYFGPRHPASVQGARR